MSDAVVVNQRTAAFDVAIGRGTPFGNPFTHMRGTRGEVVVNDRGTAIARYHRWLTTDEEIPGWTKPSQGQILTLAGQRLGCWCKPLACHGDVLIELIREWQAATRLFDDGAQAVPFLRWVGAKRWLAPTLAPWVMSKLRAGGVYCEPFLGAGAIALALPAGTSMRLGDRCIALSGLWAWIKCAGGQMSRPNLALNTREGYAAVARDFDDSHYDMLDPMPSMRMLWLNHTSFNGIYRENRAGKYNVPWGKRTRVAIPSIAALDRVRRHLERATIMVGSDYTDTLVGLPPGSVVYADPPYHQTFVGYTSFGFDEIAQAQLAARLEQLAQQGHAIATTNSDTPFIRELYPTSKWNVQSVSEPRSVAAKGSSRQRSACLLITSP